PATAPAPARAPRGRAQPQPDRRPVRPPSGATLALLPFQAGGRAARPAGRQPGGPAHSDTPDTDDTPGPAAPARGVGPAPLFPRPPGSDPPRAPRPLRRPGGPCRHSGASPPPPPRPPGSVGALRLGGSDPVDRGAQGRDRRTGRGPETPGL